MSPIGSKCRELGDDQSIEDEAVLWRRIPPWALDDRGEPDSSNFVDKERGELSVSLAGQTTLADLLEGHDGFGVVSVQAGQVRGLGDPRGKYVVRRAPLEDDPGHAVICPKLSRSDARRLRDMTEWVVRI